MLRFSAISWYILAGTVLLAAEPASHSAVINPAIARVTSLYTRAIWNDGRHNGFPGIARFGDFYYVTFRNAESHKAETDTHIFVIRSRADDLKQWERVAEFHNEHDARDPLLFVAGDRLRLVWHSKEDWTSDTTDGPNWSKQQLLDTEIVEPTPASGLKLKSQRRWLFRIRRGPDGAYYSLGRCGIKEDDSPGRFGLITYRSTDGFTFKALHTYGEGPTRALAEGGGSGWGHEADFAWFSNGMCVAAMRNSADGVLAFSEPPYDTWRGIKTHWPDFGGPALFATAAGGMLVAARETPPREQRKSGAYPARLMVRTVTSSGVSDGFYVPSSGDCGYSSFATGRKPDEVLLCYYSSHEWPQPSGTGNNPANIYLAFLTVRHAVE